MSDAIVPCTTTGETLTGACQMCGKNARDPCTGLILREILPRIRCSLSTLLNYYDQGIRPLLSHSPLSRLACTTSATGHPTRSAFRNLIHLLANTRYDTLTRPKASHLHPSYHQERILVPPSDCLCMAATLTAAFQMVSSICSSS